MASITIKLPDGVERLFYTVKAADNFCEEITGDIVATIRIMEFSGTLKLSFPSDSPHPIKDVFDTFFDRLATHYSDEPDSIGCMEFGNSDQHTPSMILVGDNHVDFSWEGMGLKGNR